MSIGGILALKSLYNKKNIFIYFFYYRENLRPPQKNTPYLFSWQIDRWQIDIFELLRCRCDVDVNSIIDSRLTCLGVIWVLMCWVSNDSIFMLRLCGQSKICHLSICQTVKGVFFVFFCICPLLSWWWEGMTNCDIALCEFRKLECLPGNIRLIGQINALILYYLIELTHKIWRFKE